MKGQLIISGATGHLGKAVVQKLTETGYTLHANVREGSNHAFEGQPDIFTYIADLSDEAQAEEFVKDAIQKAGSIEAAVLLAGGFAMGKLNETSPEDIQKMITMNFLTAFHLVKPLKKHFEEQGGGHFILIGARPALIAEQGAGSFAYTLSKTLVFKIAETINAEGKNKNITASVIVPSIIDTPDNREAMPDADFSKWIPTADIAESIAFLLSDTGRKIKEPVLKLYNQA